MSRTLLQIADDMTALNDLLDELGGDVTDQQVADYVDQMFTEVGEAFDTKVDGYCAVIRERELRAAARKEEAERLLMQAKADENAAKRLKDFLMAVMKLHKKDKAGLMRQAVIANNGGKLPLVTDPNLDPLSLPTQYQRTIVQIDTDRIRQALAGGEELPFAKLGERGQHLRIR